MKQRKSSGPDKVRFGENVHVRRTSHLERCRLVESPVYLPDSQCDCGATWGQYAHEVFEAANIVTDAGDQYYAELGAGEAATNFGTPDMSLMTAQATPAKGSDFGDLTTIATSGTVDIDATYPQTDDADGDNPGTTGADIVTWRSSFGTSQANGSIVGVAIHDSGASGTDPLLMHAALVFTKSSSDTLKVYVNHRFNGV